MGTNLLGTFTTRSDGIGDLKVAGLLRLFENDVHRVHLNAGVSLPTGGIKKTDGPQMETDWRMMVGYQKAF